MLDIRPITKLAFYMALALTPVSLWAQQQTTIVKSKPGDLDEIRKVSSLLGTDVMNHTSTKIANLRDLVVSGEGAIPYGILGFGGLGGVGETFTAVPYELLGVRLDEGKWSVNLDMTAEDLKKAPVIKSENYHELLDPQWISRVDQFVRTRVNLQNHPKRAAEAEQREHRIVDKVLLATKIRAASLKNPKNQELGKVEDLLIDRTDHIIFVILGRGGVLGIGESFIPVPWSRLAIGENRENAAITAVIDSTKAKLETAPLVKGDNYATLLAPGFADQVREYFGLARQTATSNGEANPH
jgi:sporulation protein YlmC with PRC-barrel domain